MASHLRWRRALPALAALSLLSVSCGSTRPVKIDGPRLARPGAPEQVPVLTEPQFGGGGATTSLGGEQLGTVAEATPPGLRVTRIMISPLSPAARQALKFTGFKGNAATALIVLPIEGIDPQIGMYYLIVPVVNDGDAPVRNLKARADFYDANGVIVWSEIQPVTHFPTRLGLNPPSLPNDPNVPEAGPLGTSITGFSLYYLAGNVGLFTFAVPDTAVAKTVASWTLTFLVSTT